MTDKEQIKCKYKFQDKEKFDGKTYCTCFCELCEDLPPCDDNCQIYEDFKQLARKTQECEKYKKLATDFKDVNKQLGYKYLTIKQKCEELKKKLRELELKNTTLQNRYQQLDGSITECDRYRKALEKIEKEAHDEMCDTLGHLCAYCNGKDSCITLKILDIINKAKDGKNDNSININ